MTPMTDADRIEAEARRLCEECGDNPNIRIREYGQSSWDYWAWELYREQAARNLGLDTAAG
jgi:hypothetical protein